MTDKLIEAVARAMEKFFSGADIAYGEHVEAARAALKAIEDSGTHVATQWQPIDTAPKGGGAEFVGDPRWVVPPAILLYCDNGEQVVARWDWYYAEGGRGYTDGVAWIAFSEPVNQTIGNPTHWMPLPSPPSGN